MSAEDPRVRDADLQVVAGREQAREDADLVDSPRGSAHIHVVARLERTEREQHHARREVRESVLERQRNREPCCTQNRDERGVLTPSTPTAAIPTSTMTETWIMPAKDEDSARLAIRFTRPAMIEPPMRTASEPRSWGSS